jgi:hypothetical protein
MSGIHFKETDYGFEYGALTVERVASDEAKGWVVMRADTAKTRLQIYATKTGKVRIYRDGKEVKP